MQTSAQSPIHKVFAADAAHDGFFGNGVDIDDDVAVIAAYENPMGSAYIFRFDGATWNQEAKVLASDAMIGSVAIDGDLVVLGNGSEDYEGLMNAGAAYVFRFDGAAWNEEAWLTPSDPDSFDRFGWPVAISGEVVVVGSRLNDDHGTNSGSAYVYGYDGNGWVETQKLVASDPAEQDQFGAWLAIENDVMVIGARGADVGGAAYVFRYDGCEWVEEQKLLPSEGSDGASFGRSVAISGPHIVVGAWTDDNVNGKMAGAAYVFAHDGNQWLEEQKLLPANGEPFGWFGTSAGICGDRIVVTAPQAATCALLSGSVHLFHRIDGTWVEQAPLVNYGQFDKAGFSVAVDGDVAIVGATYDDDIAPDAGAAHFFPVTGCDIECPPFETLEFEDKDLWIDSVGPFVTIDFTGFPKYTLVTDQYADLGVIFVDGNDFASFNDFSFVNDGWGLTGGNGAIHVAFTKPRYWIAVDYPCCLKIDLFSDGEWFYQTHFSGTFLGDFLGIHSMIPIDAAVITHEDDDPAVAIDDLFFGPPIVPGDIDGDGVVGVQDLVEVILGWGSCPAPPTPCPADTNGDGVVNVDDLVLVILNWS